MTDKLKACPYLTKYDLNAIHNCPNRRTPDLDAVLEEIAGMCNEHAATCQGSEAVDACNEIAEMIRARKGKPSAALTQMLADTPPLTSEEREELGGATRKLCEETRKGKV